MSDGIPDPASPPSQIPGAGGYPPPPPQGYPPAGYGYPGPPPYGVGYGYPPGYVPPELDPLAKSKVVAGILGIVLGGLGVHRFYLGFTTIGVIQIVVTVLTCGLGALWGFVEGILYLVGASGYTADSTGRPLRN